MVTVISPVIITSHSAAILLHQNHCHNSQDRNVCQKSELYMYIVVFFIYNSLIFISDEKENIYVYYIICYVRIAV